MKLERYVDLSQGAEIAGLFFASGSFGILDGKEELLCRETEQGRSYTYETEALRMTAQFTFEENGAILRRDYFTNLSSQPMEVNGLCSRFVLDGNAYEVYTQYNGWQHESRGEWQKLVTEIRAASHGMRGCDGATPMMGFHNLYTGRNTVFHLIPNAQWQISARKTPIQSDRERVLVELGFYERGLALTVAPGETVELPAVIFFSAESKLDLDAHRLHEVYLKYYPRRALPVVYNSWLYCFDRLDIDALMKQADRAADMGFEAFMIDAGWFGSGENWSREVGDWKENLVSGPRGRLRELSDRVRERGMTFGLWFEPERAAPTSRAVAEHPEYYMEQKLLDFSNPEAVEYMTEVISEQIRAYEIGWVKFDFNGTIPNDPHRSAYYRYLQGQRRFMEEIRRRFPELYITSCASGGFRMELGQGALCDSFWLSDNQGPYEGIRIVKDTLKRMPTAMIERWNVQKYAGEFPRYHDEPIKRMIHCNDGTWEFLVGINDEFSYGFMKGGPMGFSCDLLDFPEEYTEAWRREIEAHKRDREFYRNAVARILVDTEAILVIQYSDVALNRCVLQVFTKTVYARELLLYPVVDRNARYRLEEETVEGKALAEDGILLTKLRQNDCHTVELCRI